MLIQKLKILSLVGLLGLLGSGCSQKEVVTVFQTKNICFKQATFSKPIFDIFVADENIEDVNSFLDVNDSAYSKYEEQVNRNNKRCERLEDEK